MNPRTFLQEFEQSVDRDRLVDVVYDEMAGYCMDNDITEDEISTPTLEALAEGLVERGLGVPPSEDTVTTERDWRSTHGLQHTLGFERSTQYSVGQTNVYRFATRRDGEWEYLDCDPGLKVKYLQNRL